MHALEGGELGCQGIFDGNGDGVGLGWGLRNIRTEVWVAKSRAAEANVKVVGGWLVVLVRTDAVRPSLAGRSLSC